MKTPKQPMVDEAEWLAQERGMRALRSRDDEWLDEASARYRDVAAALAEYPQSRPPRDFAASVVAAVEQRQVKRRERALNVALGVFVLALVGAAAYYGDEGWHVLGDGAAGWVLAGMVCVGLSWASQRFIEFVGAGRRASLH